MSVAAAWRRQDAMFSRHSSPIVSFPATRYRPQQEHAPRGDCMILENGARIARSSRKDDVDSSCTQNQMKSGSEIFAKTLR